jgi:hypothetical protein
MIDDPGYHANRVGDLISYRNDGKDCTVIVGKVENA